MSTHPWYIQHSIQEKARAPHAAKARAALKRARNRLLKRFGASSLDAVLYYAQDVQITYSSAMERLQNGNDVNLRHVRVVPTGEPDDVFDGETYVTRINGRVNIKINTSVE